MTIVFSRISLNIGFILKILDSTIDISLYTDRRDTNKDYKFKVTPSFIFNQFSNFFNVNQNKREYIIQPKNNKFISMSKLRYNSLRLFNKLTP